MFTTTTPEPVVRPVPRLLYPALLLAGIAVMVASLLGIAVMMGLLPQVQSTPAGVREAPSAGRAAANPGAARTPAESTAVKSAGGTTAAATAVRCDECGIVDGIRAIEVREGSGVDTIVGGSGHSAITVAGTDAGAYAGHGPGKNMNRSVSYEIRVRMDDRSYRTFRTGQPAVGVGQRVRIRDGRLERAG